MSAVTSRRLSLETASVWALIGTIVVAAIILIPSASIPFLATKTFVLAAGGILTLALYVLARLSRGNIILPPLLLVGALWLPVIAYGLSAAFSGASPTVTVFGVALGSDSLVFMLVATFLSTLTALALRRPEQYKTFLRAGTYAFAALIVVQILILIIGQFASSFISPALSILGSYADLGALAGLGVVSILIAFRMTTPSARNRTYLMVLALLGLVILAVANIPLVWTLLALVSLALFVEAVMRNRGTSSDMDLAGTTVLAEDETESDDSRRPLVAPLVVLLVSLFFLIGGTLGGALASALNVNVIDVRPSWQATLAVGSQTYATSPIFGSGPGTFGSEWLKYRDSSLNQTIFWNIDFTSGIGFIPSSFVTTGIVGAVAWFIFLGLFLWIGVRALISRASDDPFIRFVSTIAFIGSCYLFALALFMLPGTILLALAFVFAGLFASTLRYGRAYGQWGIVFAKAPRIGFVIVFGLTLVLLGSIVAAYAVVNNYIAQVHLTRASAALGAGNLPGALDEATRSIAFAPTVAAYQAQAQIAQAQMNQIAASATLPAAEAQRQYQGTLSGGINAALTATRIAPNNYQSWVVLGNLYAAVVPVGVTGSYDSAKSAYEKAVELNPTNPILPYLLAQLEIANKNPKAAVELLKKSLSLKADNTAVILLLSQLEVQGGNFKDALAAAEAAVYFTPNDPNALFQAGILRAANGDDAGAAAALAGAVSANPQFANARYFLAALLAKKRDYTGALEQLNAIGALSDENKAAVAGAITALEDGKNPFPASLLSVTPPSTSGVQ